MQKRKKTGLISGIIIILLCFVLIGVCFGLLYFDLVSFKSPNIKPIPAINNIFCVKTGNIVSNSSKSDSFFSSQNLQLKFSSIGGTEVSLDGNINIDSFFQNKIKDNVDLFFAMTDQVGEKSSLSGKFIRIQNKDKKYFFIKNFLLTGNTGMKQLPLGNKIIQKISNKWFFLEKGQDFGVLTKSFDLHKFILYPQRLLSFLSQHIDYNFEKTEYKKIPFLDKTFPKFSNILKKKFFNEKNIYKLSVKDREVLLLFFGLPPSLSKDDLIKFDAYLSTNGQESQISFTNLSFYKLPYVCHGNLTEYKYNIVCENTKTEENFKILLDQNNKISFEYKHPDIQIILDGNYKYEYDQNNIYLKYKGLTSILNDDLLYRQFIDIDTNLIIDLSNKVGNIENTSGAKSLFDINIIGD